MKNTFRKVNNEKGVALIFSFLILIILLGLSSMFILRAVHESNLAKKELNLAKSFYISEAGTQKGLDELDNLINNYMYTTINEANPSYVVSLTDSHYTSNQVLEFLKAAVLNGGSPVLTVSSQQITHDCSDADFGAGSFSCNIILTPSVNAPEKIGADTWNFFYNYQMQATGNSGGSTKPLKVNGDFTVTVQRENFAKYALFTNTQTTSSGSNVWFTNKTNFAGPLHTNGTYNFYGNPSGTFEDVVDQVSQTARFYNSGFPVLLDDDNNGIKDVPIFNNGFNRAVASISLSSSVEQQDMVDQATGGNTYSSDGIYIPVSGSNLTGGVYVKGDANVTLEVDASNNPKYTVVQGGTTKKITLDKTNNQTSVDVNGTVTTYTGLPDGVDNVGTLLYVDGNINNFSGTVQEGEAVTVASTSDIIINNHIYYTDYTAAVGTPGTAGYVPPHADGASNLLGIVSWAGNVRIGTSAPNDINIHGTVLSKDKVFTVDNYSSGSPRGTATLLGGAVTNNYGAFGTFNGSTGLQVSGYGRNFVYDQRMQTGNGPPYFPSLNTFQAVTNDITDKMIFQDG